MSDPRPAGLGIGREYDFPEMRARFGTPTAPRPQLPTEAGLYAVKAGHGDDWAAPVFALDTDGWWWKLGHTGATADEVAAYAGVRPLERLIRHGEADQ
jgi:hypothetical protein